MCYIPFFFLGGLPWVFCLLLFLGLYILLYILFNEIFRQRFGGPTFYLPFELLWPFPGTMFFVLSGRCRGHKEGLSSKDASLHGYITVSISIVPGFLRSFFRLNLDVLASVLPTRLVPCMLSWDRTLLHGLPGYKYLS